MTLGHAYGGGAGRTIVVTDATPRFVTLTASGRDVDIEITKITRLEELGSGKTKVWLDTGKNKTVDEAIADVRTAIDDAT